MKSFFAPLSFLNLLLFATVCGSPAWGGDTPLENKVKAAYLYNFTKFVTWPDQTKPVQICVAGDNDISKLLDSLAQKQHEKDEFALVSSSKITPQSCQLLYLASGDTRFHTLLSGAKDNDILTVSDDPASAQKGGIVTLFSENGKIRFSINLESSRKTNLKISSKLLELSRGGGR